MPQEVVGFILESEGYKISMVVQYRQTERNDENTGAASYLANGGFKARPMQTADSARKLLYRVMGARNVEQTRVKVTAY